MNLKLVLLSDLFFDKIWGGKTRFLCGDYAIQLLGAFKTQFEIITRKACF